MNYLKNFIMKITKIKKLITHNGSFHADDIFACAALCLMLKKKGEEFEIIRTRDEEIIKNGDYVFDVGGIYDEKINRFDHHQREGAGARENGIPYSSFGLVWKKFGEIIMESKQGAELIEERVVAPIDAFDNGFDLVENKYEITPYYIQHFFLSMRPTWKEKEKSDDEMFLKCVAIAKEVLKREIIQTQDFLLAQEAVVSIYKNTQDKRVIVLDWHYPSEYVLNNFPEPLFEVYPRTDNLWAVRAIRKNPKTFINRKDLPKCWAGLRDEDLVKVSSVTDAVFCHRGLFLAVAKSKEGAVKLAELALLDQNLIAIT